MYGLDGIPGGTTPVERSFGGRTIHTPFGICRLPLFTVDSLGVVHVSETYRRKTVVFNNVSVKPGRFLVEVREDGSLLFRETDTVLDIARQRSRPVTCPHGEGDVEIVREILRHPASHDGRVCLRARIVQFWRYGYTQEEIAGKLGVSVRTVKRCQDKFSKHGAEGLYDRPRSGRPTLYTAEKEMELLKFIDENPPEDGMPRWRVDRLSERLGVSKAFIWRTFVKYGIQYDAVRSWCCSTDPDFAEKAARIISLYADEDPNTVIISMDEKPNIWFSEKKTGFAYQGGRVGSKTRKTKRQRREEKKKRKKEKKVVRGQSDTYKTMGRTNLFTLLDYKTGKAYVKYAPRKTRDIVERLFTGYFTDNYDENKKYYVVLDNYSTHKGLDKVTKEFPNVEFVYTPTSASWLNAVEVFNNMYTRLYLKGNTFSSYNEFFEKSVKFIEHYNAHIARRYKYTKREVKGSQLRNTIVNATIDIDGEKQNKPDRTFAS